MRAYLKNSILLCKESEGALIPRKFRIVKTINEGSSAVCYEAFSQDSGRGILKEFYPNNICGLERRADGQLVHSPEFINTAAQDAFDKAKWAYLEPYYMLLALKQGEDNKNYAFIPAFEIYHGYDDQGTQIGTTYVWTEEPERETFEAICEEVHKNPYKHPESKLVTILTAIDSLAKSICALHKENMIHRDIKPSNFGFLKLGNEVQTQSISLFDINSVCSVFGDIKDIVGTEGYMEPESRYTEVTNQTDIYSIGATLFRAIIVSDDIKCYKSEYYDMLPELVNQSKLIQASEANSHPRLRHILTTILQKCLCSRSRRYANCEELINDLKDALYYAIPAGLANGVHDGHKWVLEEKLDVNAEKNSIRTIQYHLYEHPLYQYCKEGEETLNVLVIGFGNYSQKFLDICLQAGQIRNQRLSVTIISREQIDKDLYLSERPELAKFFNIDGSILDSKESYGDLVFETEDLTGDNQLAINDLLLDIMCKYCDSRHPHYIFIALGDDDMNEEAATGCVEVAKELEADCSINFICEKLHSEKEHISSVYPVYVNADSKKNPLHEEIERMAYNVHLLWEKDLNLDYKMIRKRFNKKYNHNACVSSVLSLKYKLHSLGIDLENTNFSEAANTFSEMLAEKQGHTVKKELAWIEHRRWVAEKLCLGWRRIENLEECAGGATKDERAKRHVCICKSRPDFKLAEEYRSGTGFEKWDKSSKKDLEQLDDLDRMSVELHRMFARNAKKARKENLLSGDSIAGIRAVIEGNRKAIVAFQEWYSCLKDIWNGDHTKVCLYEGLKNAFLASTDNLSADKKAKVCNQVKTFEGSFYPVRASMEYRDWKMIDVSIIENIPFVLTYTDKAILAIPFVTGSISQLFQNVSAAMVVSPARIIYLYAVKNKNDISELKKSIPNVMDFMHKKRLKATVDFIIAAPRSFENDLNDSIKSGGRIRIVKNLAIDETETYGEVFGSYLASRKKGKPFFALEANDTLLAAELKGAGIYRAFPNYSFDVKKMKFNPSAGADMLKYIRKTPYITVADMISLHHSSSSSSSQPEFYKDYEKLWRKYKQKSSLWKALCDLLGRDAEKKDTLVSFKKKAPRDKNQNSDEFSYIVPFVCSESVTKIIRFLKEQEILEQGSRVNGYTTDSCEVIIVDRCGYRTLYDKLFANVYALVIPDAISLHLNTNSHEVNVVFDNLSVEGVPLPSNRRSEMKQLMQFFCNEMNYVINLEISQEGSMSFTYGSRRIKELMTTAGKMLEVYTYHKAKELGEFDDVVSGFEVDWEETGVKSEFDGILTKGFHTIFVECKARPNIDQAFLFKIHSLTDEFGINATAVLIADTEEKSFYSNAPLNAMQRERGNMMDVVTIWKPDEIENIGATLLKVVNGSYINKVQ